MLPSPFTLVKDKEGRPVPVAPTDSGWQLEAPSGLTASVKALRDARICRIAPSADCDVAQFGCGNATSLLCDALFSPAQDLALKFEGPGVRLYRHGRASFVVESDGPVTVTAEERFFEKRYGRRWHSALERSRYPSAPASWSSGPAYGTRVTEADVLNNAGWLARNLLRFGCQWVQVDEGWQGGEEGPGARRDWRHPNVEQFPRGMSALAQAIRTLGLRPALWLIPHVQSDPSVTRTAPQLWLAGGSSGAIANAVLALLRRREEPAIEWPGRYLADPTAPEAGVYFRGLARELCDEWGFEGLHFGELETLLESYRREQTSLWLPSTEPAEAIRRVFHYMRIAAGPGVSFRTDSPHTLIAGYCDTAAAGDHSGDLRGALDSLFLNATCCFTDAGPLCLAGAPLETSRLWASFVGLTGQAVTLGDRLPELSAEQVHQIRRILPVADIHPMELYPLGSTRPRIIDLKVEHEWIGPWDVVALCNWDDDPAEFELTPARLGLADRSYITMDAWSGELLTIGDLPQLQVPPHAVRVISCWPDLGRPQFVGSNRHITQGALDVNSAVWEERRLTLRGESTTVSGDPYVARIYVPPGYRVTAPEVTVNGPIATVTFRQPYDGRINWWVRFERVPA